MSALPRIFQGLASGLHHLSDRQRVIAGNIANSDTPGYKARTLEEPDFAAALGGRQGIARPTVVLTNDMAALGAKQPANMGHVVLDEDVTETKPDGNNVTLEDQLLRMGQVQADYATLTSLYAKQLKLLKTALGRNGA